LGGEGGSEGKVGGGGRKNCGRVRREWDGEGRLGKGEWRERREGVGVVKGRVGVRKGRVGGVRRRV